jgi:hypothetical protein
MQCKYRNPRERKEIFKAHGIWGQLVIVACPSEAAKEVHRDFLGPENPMLGLQDIATGFTNIKIE